MGKSAPQPGECFHPFLSRCRALKPRKGTELVQVTNHSFAFASLTLSLRVTLPQRKDQLQTGITFISSLAQLPEQLKSGGPPQTADLSLPLGLSCSSPGGSQQNPQNPRLRVLGTAPRAAARHKRSVTQRAEHRSGPPAVPGAAPSRQSPGPRSPRPPWRRAGPPSHNPGQPSSARRSPTGGPGGTREFPAHRPAVPAPLEAAVPADGGGWRPMAAGPTHRTQLRRHAAPETAERGAGRGGSWEM